MRLYPSTLNVTAPRLSVLVLALASRDARAPGVEPRHVSHVVPE
ncbi:MAG TPA: hypothetical protein VKA97_00430 [Pyrinomonadaceae bacterium]|nr:hypothetical protein [Pyrinomonadaceae bacterium]